MSRLFRILYLLLEYGQMTAPQLAEKLEVSVRTIYRDIDQLSASGIPVYATQGKGGGIQIDSTFVLDRSFLSKEEQQEILTMLDSYQQISNSPDGLLLEKLNGLFPQQSENWLKVDFSCWGENDTFEILKQGIRQQRYLEFSYANSSGECSQRKVEPYTLWFKHKDWYLWGYCTEKQDGRLFRFSRMGQVQLLEETFLKREVSFPQQTSWDMAPTIQVVLEVQPEQTYRVLDEFSPDQVEKQPDGSFRVTMEYIENNWLYGYLLSFGGSAKVISPTYLQKILLIEADKIKNLYG